MNITRHNYEEFFILYWDNELPAEQKKLVENFVFQNAYLQDEFRVFGETRFIPDKSLGIDNKNNLLITENTIINSSNYQDFLLSYIDNELSKDDKKVFESFYKNQPLVQKELILYQKSKLQPESEIIFPDKSLLCRKEEKVRVLNISWPRIAAAAVLLLFAGYLGYQFIVTNNSNKTISIPTASTNGNKEEPLNDKINQPLVNSPVEVKTIEKDESAQTIAVINRKTLPNQKTTNPQTNEDDQIIDQTLAITQTPEQSYSIEKITNKTLTTVDSDKAETNFNDFDVTERNTPSFHKQYNNNDVLFASNNESQDDKGGLKGLLRKATRIFGRHTKIQTTTDDNKLLLGAFTVSLK